MSRRRPASGHRSLRRGVLGSALLLALGAAPAWASSTPPGSAHARGSGGVSVTVTAHPGSPRAGAAVRLSIDARDARARGALGYRAAFGDGTGSVEAVPQYCLAAPKAERVRWHLVHRYRRPGTYEVTVSARAACGRGAATARLRLRVR